MDWNAAIDNNREALKRILATLVAMAGLAGTAAFTSPLWGGRREASGGGCAPTNTPTRQSDDCRPPHKGEVGPELSTLPRHLHRAVLRLLRPAEAAARRLIVAAARKIMAELPPSRPRKLKPAPKREFIEIHPSIVVSRGRGTGILLPPDALRRIGPDGAVSMYLIPKDVPVAPSPPPRRKTTTRCRNFLFALLDPPRRPFTRRRPRQVSVPRIWAPGWDDPVRTPARRPPLPNDPIDATRLGRRFQALASALDDLPAQARRYQRWEARRDAARNAGRLHRVRPLRPGRAPGWRQPGSRRAYEVHEVLDVTHDLALWALERPDTS